MFVLDTNILSAMMAPNPAPEVAAFVSGQPAELLFTASICQAEILSGIAIMAEGRRRRGLEAAASHDCRCRLLPECNRRHPRHRRLRGVRRRNRQSVESVTRSVTSYEGREDAMPPK
jgi:hypothetical protein